MIIPPSVGLRAVASSRSKYLPRPSAPTATLALPRRALPAIRASLSRPRRLQLGGTFERDVFDQCADTCPVRRAQRLNRESRGITKVDSSSAPTRYFLKLLMIFPEAPDLEP